jgi:DNA-binding transcriptional LysR family regulator
MDISWEDAQTFLAVAEQRSFSAAARLLDLGQPTISRRIASLEARIGHQLFWRGKRGAELTEDGARLLPAAEQMARWAGEFGRLAQGADESLAGTVRIAAPPGTAVDYLAPFAQLVRDRMPEVRLEVLASIDHVDLSRGVADIAVRTREPHEPELTTLHSIEMEMGVFAAESYAVRFADRVADATEIDWITWAFPYEHVPPRPLLERVIPDFQPIFASDNYLVQKSAARSGVGAMIVEKTEHRPSANSDLVELQVDLPLSPGAMHLVCAKSMQYVPRVRAVADLLIEQLGLTWSGGM